MRAIAPALAATAPKPGWAVRARTMKSALLALDNPAFSVRLGLTAAAITLVCLAVRIGLPLLWAGTLAFLHTAATRELLRKYGVL